MASSLKGKYRQNLLNSLVAAQNFEYKMLNILDKSLCVSISFLAVDFFLRRGVLTFSRESVFGYITVLVRAYRYIALQSDSTGEGPLQKIS